MNSQALYALRRWTRRPRFAATVLLVLALGIGATSAMFVALKSVVFRTLPWPQSEELSVIHAVQPDRRGNPAFSTSWDKAPVSWSAWQQLRTSPAFTDVGAWVASTQIVGHARSEHVEVAHVSASLLPVLRGHMSHGRFFLPHEDEVEAQTAILSHSAWHRYFGGRQDVIGQTLILAPHRSSRGLPKEIVGILPPEFSLVGTAPDVLLPLGLRAYPAQFPGVRFLRLVGRRAPGVSIKVAGAHAEPIVRENESFDRRTARVVSLADAEVGHAKRPLWLLFVGAAFFWLVACANVIGLILGENRRRSHELAVQRALGGERRHAIKQVIIEYVAIGIGAGIGGATFAALFASGLRRIAPAQLPELGAIHADVGTIGFIVCLSVVTTMLCGAVPAAQAYAREGQTLVPVTGSKTARLRGYQALVAVELGLATVLVVSTALFGQTLIRLASRPLGFDPSQIAVLDVSLTGQPRTEDPPITPPASIAAARAGSLTRELRAATRMLGVLQQVNDLPSVTAVAGVNDIPFGGRLSQVQIRPVGRPPEEKQGVQRLAIAGAYFEALQIPVVRGRIFDKLEHGSSQVAVVSRELAKRFFQDDPIGRQFAFDHEAGSVIHTVIGVVENAKQRTRAEEDLATFYVPIQSAVELKHLIVRSTDAPSQVLPAAREAIRRYEPHLVVTSTYPMEQLVAAAIAQERFRGILAASFGVTGVGLAALGLFGLAHCWIVERQREIGIRIALGASRWRIRWLLMGDMGRVVIVGLLAGLPVAFAVSQAAQSLLFGVSGTSPSVFMTTASVLTVAGFCSLVGPARRAVRVDPSTLLRE